MKRFYTLAFITCFFTVSLFAQSRPVNTLTAWWGNWSNSSSWSLGRIPEDGDSVVIPQSKGVVFDKEIDYSNLVIKVFGTLQVKKQMSLDAQSVIEIDATGLINAFASNRKKETIVIDGKNKYDENSVYSITGPSYASAKTGVAPNGFAISGNTLPVHFTNFTVTGTAKEVKLTWTTAEEINNKHFEVEKSIDGLNWNMLAVQNGAGTSNTMHTYTYSDKNIAGSVVYYRIKQVDVNGSFSYSSVRKISLNEVTTAAKIYASSRNTVTVDFNNSTTENISIQVMNLNGQVIANTTYKQAVSKITMPVNVTVPGIYIVKVSDGNSRNEVKKIML